MSTGNHFYHFIKFLLGKEIPNTQTTKIEQETIAYYAKGKKAAVEIGVYEGFNTLVISKSISKDGILYAIDPFFKGRLGVSYSKKIATRYIARHNLGAKVVFIEKLSFEAADDLNNDLDFIFIDGDHSYEGIKKDWEMWSKKVEIGGHILLHDTSVPIHDAGVKMLGSYKYFNEEIRQDDRFEIIKEVDSINVLKRVN